MYIFGEFSVLLLIGAVIALFVKLGRAAARIDQAEERLILLTQTVAALEAGQSAGLGAGQASGQGAAPAPVAASAPSTAMETAAPDVTPPASIPPDVRQPAAIPSDFPPSARVFAAAAQSHASASPTQTPTVFVFKASTLEALTTWLVQNWTLAIAALSLMLGGLFMVQYGIENGLLSPKLRVIFTLLLGAALIGGGEFLRRRFGDHAAATASLPSTLSGAGVVVVFIGVLSAHSLYGLIGPLTAMVGLALVSFGALLLGWIYGAALSMIGIVGAVVAPFLIGGGSENTRLLYPYFALIAGTGLAIDSFKRRAWISALAIGAPSLGIAVLWAASTDALGLAVAALAIALAAVMIPERGILPMPQGETVLEQIRRAGTAGFPARLGFAGMALASAAGLVLVADAAGMAQLWLGFGLLIVLAAFGGIWLAPARALADLAVPPVAGVLLALVAAPMASHAAPRWTNGVGMASGETVVALAGLAAALSWAAFWRMRGAGSALIARYFAFGAALVLPASLLILDLFWSDRFVPDFLPLETPPAADFWGFGWAVTVLGGAGLMVAFAQMRLRLGMAQEGAQAESDARFEAGLFAASACVLMTLALFVMLTQAALTLALAVLVVAAAVLYRRFAMAPLAWVFQLGTAVIGYRLLADPGLMWSMEGSESPLASVLLAHLGPLAGFVAVIRMIPRATNPLIRATAESAALTTGSLTVMVVLARLAGDDFWSHWGFGLMAAIWAGSALGQVYRRRETTGIARIVRVVMAAISGAVAALMTLLMLVGLMFLLDGYSLFSTGTVFGPPIFDSLALALLPLAATLGLGGHVLYPSSTTGKGRWLRGAFLSAAAGLFGLWGWFEIRRLWRGPDLSVGAVSDGELYSYTIALLALSLVVLAAAVWRRSVSLRKLAMLGVALTIAKVFLLDMAGLSGLTRVASFVGLGLALTGLAWLNRKITEIWGRGALPQDQDTKDV